MTKCVRYKFMRGKWFVVHDQWAASIGGDRVSSHVAMTRVVREWLGVWGE